PPASPRVGAGGRAEPAAAGRTTRNLGGTRTILVNRQPRARAGAHQREPRELLLRHVERRVLHAERLENARAQKVGERLAGELLDEIALHLDADAVRPARTRLPERRTLRKPGDHVLQRP